MQFEIDIEYIKQQLNKIVYMASQFFNVDNKSDKMFMRHTQCSVVYLD